MHVLHRDLFPATPKHLQLHLQPKVNADGNWEKMTKSCQTLTEIGKHVEQLKWLSLYIRLKGGGDGGRFIHTFLFVRSFMGSEHDLYIENVAYCSHFDAFSSIFTLSKLIFFIRFALIFTLGEYSGVARICLCRPVSLSFNYIVKIKMTAGAGVATNSTSDSNKRCPYLVRSSFYVIPVLSVVSFLFAGIFFLSIISCTHFFNVIHCFLNSCFYDPQLAKEALQAMQKMWIRTRERRNNIERISTAIKRMCV